MNDELPRIPQAYQPPVHGPVAPDEPVSHRRTRRRGFVGLVAVLTLALCGGAALLVTVLSAPDGNPATATAAATPASSGAADPPSSTTGWPELTARPASAEKSLTDASDGATTWIHFANTTGGTVTVMWLDYDHKRVWYADLAPGRSYDQQTYTGHVWVVTRPDATAIALYTAAADPSTAVIR